MATGKRKEKRTPSRGKGKPTARPRLPIRRKRSQAKAAPVVRAVTHGPTRGVHMKALSEPCLKNLLIEIAGEKALHVAGELRNPMTDEDLADAAKIKISEVRAVMNKLHSARIAAYSRTRNEDGWYTYTWSLALDHANKILEERGIGEKQAQGRAGEPCEYYACPNCYPQTKKRFGFDKASESSFKCPECSEMLSFVEKK